MARVVVVDDERSMREFMELLLERDGHEVATARHVAEALSVCERQLPALVFVDLKLPDGTGIDVLRWLRDHQPQAQVIMMTAFATTQTAVEAMRLGAYDYQIKPVKVDELRALTQKALEKYNLLEENRQLRTQLNTRYGLSRFVCRSAQMVAVVELIDKVAPTHANVLIEGESGTGKELVARAIHEGSARVAGPFVPINCGAIPESLIEAELFGHVAGAFTGASRQRAGLFEAANGGTLLLDEISELPQNMQVKLLRALQERVIRRVGEEHERSFDARIVASTNRDLQMLVATGGFREDLFYRLNVVRIRVPPLRDRGDDVPLLARAFVLKYAEKAGKAVDSIDAEAMRALMAFDFPGNVRELENYMERAVALCSEGTVRLHDLPDELRAGDLASPSDLLSLPPEGIDLDAALARIERRFVSEALQRAGGVKSQACDLLGLTLRSLRYRLNKLGLAAPEAEPDATSFEAELDATSFEAESDATSFEAGEP